MDFDREIIIGKIKSSKKYNNISDELIERLVEAESLKYKQPSQVLKSVKTKLHQISGMFISGTDIKKAYEFLDEDNINKILELHISTKERINTYQELYSAIFSITGRPDSILDLACGLNPFSLNYIGTIGEYTACDINTDIIALLNTYFKKINQKGAAFTKDLLSSIPDCYADVAFAFKLLPLLEQQKKNYSLTLLSKINSKYLAITYPIESIGGVGKGQYDFYSGSFEKMINNSNFKIEIKLKEKIGNELLYVICRGDSHR